MQNEFKNAQISTIEKGGGHFIVEVNGKIIYSKKDLFNCEVDRFPNEGEITQLIKMM
ncbi:Rdx family protein [Campylobacter volucris]|nr:Rdx family protein [Campylobacter volucris]